MDLKQAYNQAVNVNFNRGNKETNTEYNIYEDESTIRIAFKGSTSDMDWKQNFMFWKKPYKHMEKIFFVHAGFLKKYKSVRDEIIDYLIKPLVASGKCLEIRGYSQGAALALLLHEDVFYNIRTILPETIVFGSPRVFTFINGKLLQERLINVLRVQYGNDTVTKVPFIWMLFKHYGESKNIGTKRRWFKFSFKDHLKYKELLRG